MCTKLETAIGIVKEHLEFNYYSYGKKMGYLRCCRLLNAYLAERNELYSRQSAEQWLQNIAPKICESRRKEYRMALMKLEEAYHQGEISSINKKSNARRQREQLDPWCKDALDAFMEAISDGYDSSYPFTVRTSVVRFLNHISNEGISKAGEISHKIIAEYYRDDKHGDDKFKDLHNCCIRTFLCYLAERGKVQNSIPLTLDKFVLSRLVFIESLPTDIKADFAAAANDPSASAVEYYNKALELSPFLENHRYAKTMRSAFPKAWKDLYVFLEANSLEYSLKLALTWANHMSHYTVQWECFRRAFMLFEQYRRNGQINPRITYRYQADRADALPEWCKADYLVFLLLKEKEGLAGSTLTMCRSSCLRLLEYLNANHISAWDMVTPETLKAFHRQDPHSTPEAKNAYSSKIRMFIEHLGEIGRVSPTLFMAVPGEFAPKVNIVKTLHNDDIANLYQFQEHADSAYGMRDAAMIMIGLRMGLRASDITKLKFSDVSWAQKTISIQQQKTGRFLKLPMPVEVGNAIYRYIIHGRPDASSEYVFITHKVPYSKLHRCACRNALSKAIPENTEGFHITRKTFASKMLANGVSADRISEALGHATNSTAMQYLSTDDENMRRCALPLARIPVKGGGLS